MTSLFITSIRVLLKSHHLRSGHLLQNSFTTNHILFYINRQSSMPFRRGSVVPSTDRGENRAFHRVGGWHTGNPSSSAGGIYRLREVWGGVSYSLYFDKWFCLTRQWPVKHLVNREVSSAALWDLQGFLHAKHVCPYLACQPCSCGIDSHGLKRLFVTEELDCLGLGHSSFICRNASWSGLDKIEILAG